MKELSIEQKAKAYDEAKLRMSAAYDSNRCTIGFMNEIFPELKESSERIKSAAIEFVRQNKSFNHCLGISKEDAIAWLEKHANLMKCLQVANSKIGNLIEENYYLRENLEKQGKQKPVDKVEPKFKVGDKVQYSKGCGTIMTIEKIENNEYIFGNNLGHTTIEDGNKWYLVERNPTWSEEDEKNLLEISCLIGNYRTGDDEYKLDSWLNSIKDRVQPQPKQKWSEEDNIILSRIIADYEKSNEEWFNAQKSLPHGRKITWLKSLRDRYTWKPSDEQITVLHDVAAYVDNSLYPNQKQILINLYLQLKKLQGE